MNREIKNNTFLLISLGAIPGALFRMHVDQIYIVNIIGCFLLGFFNSLAVTKRYKLTLGVGLCASMTTYSGWSLHLHDLLHKGMYKLFLFNAISSEIIGVLITGLGYWFAKKLNA